MRRGEAGFTVIEVIIVTAIAGLLLIGAFVAMSSSIESTRFSDTMTTTQSFLQKEYLEVAAGDNARDNTLQCDNSGNVTTVSADTAITPGGSNCILLGRMVTVQEGLDTLYSRYIIGTEPATPASYTSDTAAVLAYNPKVVYSASDTANKTIKTFKIPWSARIIKVRNSSAAEVRHFSIIRSPLSERILIYGNITGDMNATTINATQLNQKTDVCLDSETGLTSRRGHLMFGAGQGQDLFTVERVGTTAC